MLLGEILHHCRRKCKAGRPTDPIPKLVVLVYVHLWHPCMMYIASYVPAYLSFSLGYSTSTFSEKPVALWRRVGAFPLHHRSKLLPKNTAMNRAIARAEAQKVEGRLKLKCQGCIHMI